MKTYVAKGYPVLAAPLDLETYNEMLGKPGYSKGAGFLVQVIGRKPNYPSLFPHYIYWTSEENFHKTFEQTIPNNYVTTLMKELATNADQLVKITNFLQGQAKLPQPSLPQEDLADLYFKQQLLLDLTKITTKQLEKAKQQQV